MSLKFVSGLVFVLFAVCLVSSEEEFELRSKKYEDAFSVLDQQGSYSLLPLISRQYLWPWAQLVKAAAALDDEESLEEPLIASDKNKFEINVNVKNFKPDEIKAKVKDRFITIVGKHMLKNNKDGRHYISNHFVQRFTLPADCKPEEVSAVLKDNGMLKISALRHEVPPPPPERDIPIEIRKPDQETVILEKLSTTTTEEKNTNDVIITGSTDKTDITEATTHIGKIRKKELKAAAKEPKKDEGTKPMENNVLDYSILDVEE